MNNKHLSWNKEINNKFIIASRAYFLQHARQNEVVCNRWARKYGYTYSSAKKYNYTGEIVSGRKYIPHSQSLLNVSVRMYIPERPSKEYVSYSMYNPHS